MNIVKDKIQWICMVIIILLAIMYTPGLQKVVHASKEELANHISTDQVKIDFEVGYDNVIRIGRTTTLAATIVGTKGDFSGSIKITYKDSQGQNIQYEKPFRVTKMEEVNLIFQIKLLSPKSVVDITLLNEKSDVVDAIELTFDQFEYENQPMIGILTEDINSVSYLSAFGSMIYSLYTSDLGEEYWSYDMMDVIVVDNFDLYLLSDHQFDELLRFVEQGGVIALGTGENYDKVLKRFVDQGIFQVEQGEVRQENINFELEPEYENELIARVVDHNFFAGEYKKIKDEEVFFFGELNNSTHVAYINNFLLLENYQYGSGNFEVFHINLGNENQENLYSLMLLDYILDYMSMNRKNQISYEVYGHLDDYNLYQAISNSETDNIPSLGKFITAIIIYILVVGPVAYLVLRILGKRKYLWIAISTISIAFTIIMYSLGNGTRIETLYSCYFNLIRLNGSNEVTETCVVNLSTPNNRDYTLELPITSYFGAINNDYYSYEVESNQILDNERANYHRKITYHKDNLEIALKNYKAFSPVYFEGHHTFDLDYDFKSQLKYTYDGMEGSITNELGFPLEQAVLLSGNHIVSLGTIEDKQEVSVSDKSSFTYQSRDSYSAYNFISEVVHKDTILPSNQKRMIAAMTYALEQFSIGNENESFVVGFADTIFENSIVDTLSTNIQSYGNQLLILPVEVEYQVGDSVLVPSIDPYMLDGENVSEFSKYYRYLEDVLIQEYQLPKEETIETLYYLDHKNREYDKENYQGFTGEIYAMNIQTKEYDLIFNEDNRICENIEDYLEDNRITLKYKPDSGIMNYIMTLPFISYTKEAS